MHRRAQSASGLPRQVKRLLVPLMAAGFATLLCFALMVYLLGERPESTVPAVSPTSYLRLPEARELERPPSRTQPRKLMPVESPPVIVNAELALEGLQKPEAEKFQLGSMADLIGPIDIQPNIEFSDHKWMPTVVVQPVYPLVAEMKQIEGYVIVSFAVRENGTVVNPVVVKSEPDAIFDQAAIHAISRFRFAPRSSEQPEPMIVAENQMRFVFSLDDLRP